MNFTQMNQINLNKAVSQVLNRTVENSELTALIAENDILDEVVAILTHR